MKSDLRIDFTSLVDILSNVAGMMIIFACMALMVKVDKKDTAEQVAKPINFPLSYLPLKKNSVAIALKGGRLYMLPSRALLEEVTERTAKGEVIESLELEKNGVLGRIELTRTALGFRFKYGILPNGGIPISSAAEVKKALDKMLEEYPPDRYFVMAHVWEEDFETFRNIREYLNEQKVEVGWHPRLPRRPNETWDITMAVGEYSEGFTSIKAQ